jgi:HD-like signal output (HDOD) protein
MSGLEARWYHVGGALSDVRMRSTDDYAPNRVTLDQLQLLLRRRDQGSPRGESVVQLLDELAQGASLHEIERLTQRNAELSLRIVRIAGSAAFGGHEIKSIRHAIEMLGFDQLYSIVATIALVINCPRRNLVVGIDRERFQRRSLLIGLLSRMLAQKLSLPNPEGHYMAGLFQECGYLPISRFVTEKLEQVIAVCKRTEVGDLCEIEQYYLGFTHCDAGGMVGKEYHFSEEICTAVVHHHAPMFAEPKYQKYADVAHMASWLADELGHSIFEGCPAHSLDRFTSERLGIDPQHFHPILASVQETLDASYRTMAMA